MPSWPASLKILALTSLMKSALLLFVLIFTTTLVFAQDDYVLEKDVPKVKRVFSGTPNPDFTNYALTASAYPLPKRDFRFSGTDIIFAKASYGLTNETTVSVNLSLIGTFIGAIKHNINIREGFDLAFSGSFGQALFIPEDTLAIIGGGDTVTQIGGGQVIATLGDHQNNLTGGIGVYYAKSNYEIIAGEEELFLNNVFIAGQKQLRNKILNKQNTDDNE